MTNESNQVSKCPVLHGAMTATGKSNTIPS